MNRDMSSQEHRVVSNLDDLILEDFDIFPVVDR